MRACPGRQPHSRRSSAALDRAHRRTTIRVRRSRPRLHGRLRVRAERRAARRHWLSPLRVLDWVDDAAGFSAVRRGSRARAEGFELGLLLFTPQDLGAEQPLHDDRPYANLLYVASSKLDARRGARRGISVVALDRVPRVAGRRAGSHRRSRAQRQHRAARLRSSDLGRRRADVHVRSVALSPARERHGLRGRRPYSVRAGFGGSIGYITEVNVEIAFRTDGPWWESSFAASNYAGHPQVDADARSASHAAGIQFEAGARMHARVPSTHSSRAKSATAT